MGWKAEREDRAASGCVGGVDRAALVVEQTGCDGESEACPAGAAVAGVVGADRGLEDAGEEVG
jgi:hypothetical protein